MEILINDLKYELKKRTVNAKTPIIEKVLAKLNITNSQELIKHYGWKECIYNKFHKDYLNEIFAQTLFY